MGKSAPVKPIDFKIMLFRLALSLLVICGLLTLLPLPKSQGVVVTLEFLGSFHPVILHLPIGLWFGLVLLLLADSLCKERSLRKYLFQGGCVTFITGVGAFITGANLYLAGAYSRATLVPHMYAALFFLAGVLLFCVLVYRKAGSFVLWLTAIVSMAVLVYAGHVGGVITHGDPMEKAPWVVLKQQAHEHALKEASRKASAKDPYIFDHIVLPILENKCIDCHGTARAKGKLRMDSFDALIQGGANGPSLVPGDLKRSLLLERIHLPLTVKEHMPPEDQEQVTAEELAFLEWWVGSAADPLLKVADTAFPDHIKPTVLAYTGDSPDAIRRRQERELKARLLKQYHALSSVYPGIVIQSVQGEPRFELNSASIYDVDEAALRALIKPLTPYVVRIDWYNRRMDHEWMSLINTSSNLEVLNIKQSDIPEAQLIALVERNLNLHSVNLYGVGIGDAIIPIIKPRIAKGQLTRVNLSETKLSPEGLQDLQAAIPRVTLRF